MHESVRYGCWHVSRTAQHTLFATNTGDVAWKQNTMSDVTLYKRATLTCWGLPQATLLALLTMHTIMVHVMSTHMSRMVTGTHHARHVPQGALVH